jgi:hypothetical protein
MFKAKPPVWAWAGWGRAPSPSKGTGPVASKRAAHLGAVKPSGGLLTELSLREPGAQRAKKSWKLLLLGVSCGVLLYPMLAGAPGPAPPVCTTPRCGEGGLKARGSCRVCSSSLSGPPGPPWLAC